MVPSAGLYERDVTKMKNMERGTGNREEETAVIRIKKSKWRTALQMIKNGIGKAVYDVDRKQHGRGVNFLEAFYLRGNFI